MSYIQPYDIVAYVYSDLYTVQISHSTAVEQDSKQKYVLKAQFKSDIISCGADLCNGRYGRRSRRQCRCKAAPYGSGKFDTGADNFVSYVSCRRYVYLYFMADLEKRLCLSVR